MHVRALFVAERLKLQAFESTHLLANNPLTISIQDGCAVLFRYGVVVLFDVDSAAEVTLMESLSPFLITPMEQLEQEQMDILVEKNALEGVHGNHIHLQEITVERLQIIADILAKSVVLAEYEKRVAAAFDRVEPLAGQLKRGQQHHGGRELLRHISETLLVQHKMVGRVEVTEKPELLWEQPHLERLFLRLEDEFELHERHAAMERKLEVIHRTADTLLDLLQTRRSLRVEWYIVILIVVEIFLTLYELFLH